MKTLAQLLALLSLVAIVGCGAAGPQTYEVTGKVSFSGEPIKEGTITFEDSEKGVAESFDIGADGSYAATLPQGTYGVSIQPPTVEVADTRFSEGGDEFKKVDNIPNRYWSSYESGLSMTIANANTSFDVDMKPGRR